MEEPEVWLPIPDTEWMIRILPEEPFDYPAHFFTEPLPGYDTDYARRARESWHAICTSHYTDPYVLRILGSTV